ncbi:hypothetical protein OH76DRAFT_1420250 [Lentinus brumalis]|uniref:Uncharacterized protein n=1 Tax=Lentinus brumalis TaxID=2498619 RepID=A0A371D1J9_9APHY|nr:hypothetical protein OH76DRAFT_1420250 [Polyporus brumalis]
MSTVCRVQRHRKTHGKPSPARESTEPHGPFTPGRAAHGPRTARSSEQPLAPTGIPQIDGPQEFINALRSSTCLEDSSLDPDAIDRLRNPPRRSAVLSPDEELALKLFLAHTHSSEQAFTDTCSAIMRRNPDNELPSLHSLKKLIAELTGVDALIHDMCPDSCMAYTGPFKDRETCLYCKTPQPRYEPTGTGKNGVRKPLRQFSTFPLGPQLQARFLSTQGAHEMRHRQRRMQTILEEVLKTSGNLDRISDFYEGSDFWDAYEKGCIGDDDVCVIFSMDGAQLFEHKASNCWIYIWILVDIAPDLRYKKKYVLPGAIVPGPAKPKHPESFLFPGFQHVTILQREGFKIWDAARRLTFVSRPFVFLAEADAIGAPDMTGYVSHHGKQGCRTRCKRHGRRKPGGSHYYSVCLKPNGYSEQGCDDSDFEPSDIPESLPEDYEADLQNLRGATSVTNYEARRLETGISKPSIFLGLSPEKMLPIPRTFPPDIMHLFGLNITDLLLKLWRGLMDCDTKNGDSKDSWDFAFLVGEVWIQHGALVAAARHYLPGSFDRPPRNPAEKVSSGYKCWEFLTWFYGLAPGLLYGIMPLDYWQNFCKLVAGVRIIYQRETVVTQRTRAHQLLSDFAYDFETLYVKRKISRMHFVPQCVHALTHTPTEYIRIGPLICCSQFTMERIIGQLGSEISQPSRPFENLAQRALRRTQENILKTMFPILDETPETKVPKCELGNGYVLLHPRDDRFRRVQDEADIVILRYIEGQVGLAEAAKIWVDEMKSCVRKWARCRLPNGQISRCAWKEEANKMTRLARNVKVRHPVT